MNKTNFNQAGGFPLKTERLQELQTAYEIFNHLGNIAGNLSILSGCAVTGSSVTDGVVVIDNEVIVFKGGYVAANVIIIEEAIDKEFEDGSIKKIHTVRYATFGTAATSWPWTSFKKPIETKTLEVVFSGLRQRIEQLEARPISFIPIGLIAIWGRPVNEIPIGWVEYVELSGRVPVGLDKFDANLNGVGRVGGSKDAVVVSHNHTITDSGNVNNGGAGGEIQYKTARWDRGSGTLLNGTISTVGESGINKNMQPYRVVHFIKYVG